MTYTNKITRITKFLNKLFTKIQKNHAIIAVSGGIDSAISLTLTTQALAPSSVLPILLPYGEQDMTDATTICQWNKIPQKNITSINIKKTVDEICSSLDIKIEDKVRRGNIMARVRMMMIFDLAKKKNGLVVGTENKSEHYLGYFTRFGDEASDVEPIIHLYKSEIIELAKHLDIPKEIINKPPSADLWKNQTDEKELGFSYKNADIVLHEMIDNKNNSGKNIISNISQEIKKRVLKRVKQQIFKQRVPYKLED